MRKIRLTLGVRLTLMIVGGGALALGILSYTLIRIQANNHNEAFTTAASRLTTLMAKEIAPALHLQDERIVKKKVKAFLATAEEKLLRFTAYDLEGNQVFNNGEISAAADLDQQLKANLKILASGETAIKESPDRSVMLRPAFLPGDEAAGYVAVPGVSMNLSLSTGSWPKLPR